MFDNIGDRWLESQARSVALLLYMQSLSAMASEIETFLVTGAFVRDLGVMLASPGADERRWALH